MFGWFMMGKEDKIAQKVQWTDSTKIGYPFLKKRISRQKSMNCLREIDKKQTSWILPQDGIGL